MNVNSSIFRIVKLIYRFSLAWARLEINSYDIINIYSFCIDWNAGSDCNNNNNRVIIAFERRENFHWHFQFEIFLVIDNWPRIDGKPRAHEVWRNEQNITGSQYVKFTAGLQGNVSKFVEWESLFCVFLLEVSEIVFI